MSPADRNGQGNGTTTFTRSYDNGTSVTLTAPSSSGGKQFTGWSGVDSQNGTTAYVTMNSDKTVTANYGTYKGSVIVVSSTPLWGTVTGGGTYSVGQSIQIMANANAGYRFTGWQDGNTANPRTVTVQAGTTTYTAYFAANGNSLKSGIFSQSGDFNGDGRDDLAVYDSSSGKWFIYNLATGRSLTPAAGFSWGFAGAVPAPGDFDGDGHTDLGVYDSASGKWFIYSMASGRSLTPRAGLTWGFAGATPVVADFNGDGHDDLGVYDTASGKWFIYNMVTGKSLTPLGGVSWGFAGASPVAADYDGDRHADLGVYDTASGKWFIYSMATGRSLTPRAGLAWGSASATPIAADYNGDGRADLGIFDAASAKWFIYNLRTGKAIAWNLAWGFAGVTPVKGHYFRAPRFRADDPDNVTVYDSATGKWYIYSIQQHAAKLWGMRWGYAGAIPIGAPN